MQFLFLSNVIYEISDRTTKKNGGSRTCIHDDIQSGVWWPRESWNEGTHFKNWSGGKFHQSHMFFLIKGDLEMCFSRWSLR